MSNETTPTIQRVKIALENLFGGHVFDSEATAAAEATLDVEELARELFVADSGQDRAFALGIWRAAPDDQVVKKHWRRIATTARTALLGTTS